MADSQEPVLTSPEVDPIASDPSRRELVDPVTGALDLRDSPNTRAIGENDAVATLRAELDHAERDDDAMNRTANALEEEALYVSPAFSALLKEIKENGDTPTDTLSASPDAPVDTERKASDIVLDLEQDRFAKDPPRFTDQAEDTTRRMPFFYFKGHNPQSKPMTEREGLAELKAFLEQFIGTLEEPVSTVLPAKTPDLIAQAQDMLENLTFIGDKEFQEAAKGISSLWKAYLDEDPKRQLCVLAEVGQLHRYRQKQRRKSDEHLLDTVLDYFSDEEQEKYADRLVFSIRDLRSLPEQTRIVLLDDWTISGTQMRNVHGKLLSSPKARKYIQANCLEVNLVAASKQRIENGLEVNPYDPSKGSIRLRAYYRAHEAPQAKDTFGAYITGLHCAVNYGFYLPCRAMRTLLRNHYDIATNVALTRIAQPYKFPHLGGGIRERIGGKLKRVLLDGKGRNDAQ